VNFLVWIKESGESKELSATLTFLITRVEAPPVFESSKPPNEIAFVLMLLNVMS